MELYVIPIIIFFIVLIVIAFLSWEKSTRLRQQGITEFAKRHSFTYRFSVTPDWLGISPPFPILSKGSNWFQHAMLADLAGATVRLFDFTYQKGFGKSKHTFRFSVIYFKSEKLSLPMFTLEPRSFFHGIQRTFGIPEIEISTHPKFCSAFVLRGEDEVAIRQFLTLERLNVLMNHPDLLLNTAPGHCLVCRSPWVKVADYEVWLQEAEAIFRLFCEEAGSSDG